jgi:mono/diheme cytochrome c family protein
MSSERDRNDTMKKTTYTILAISSLAIASMFTACVKDNPDSPGYEFMPDMYRSPSYETNGLVMQVDSSMVMDTVTHKMVWLRDTVWMANFLAPDGSIPRGFTPFPYENTPQGDSLASIFWKSPMVTTDAIENQGEELYGKYCTYCHGKSGDGNGPLVESGKFPNQPPDYKKLAGDGKLTDGHVYHVITYGKGVMGSHASQLTNEERWKVIAYVQKLARGGKSWTEFKATPVVADSAAATDSAKVEKPVNHAGH